MNLEQHKKKKRMNLKNHFPIKFRFAGFHFLRHPRTWNVEISGRLKNDFYSSKTPGTHRSVDQRKIVNIPKNSNFAIKVKHFFFKKNIPQFEKTLARENLYSSIVVTLIQ